MSTKTVPVNSNEDVPQEPSEIKEDLSSKERENNQIDSNNTTSLQEQDNNEKEGDPLKEINSTSPSDNSTEMPSFEASPILQTATENNKKNKIDNKNANAKEATKKLIARNKKKSRARKPGDVIVRRQETIDALLKYQMGQIELKKFKKMFAKIDVDQSGEIDYDEFFDFLKDERTAFSDGLLKLIDVDTNGRINYEEFVHAITVYCMFTRDEILQFAFDMFDIDGSGSIDEQEFMRLCTLINGGKPTYPGNFKKALEEFDRNGDGLIDLEEFKFLNKRYPLILFPCFRLQDRMQKNTLGYKHWHKLAKRYYQKLVLENYRRKHNGSVPPISFWKRLKNILGIGIYHVYQA